MDCYEIFIQSLLDLFHVGNIQFYHPTVSSYNVPVEGYMHMNSDGSLIPICNAFGGSISIPANVENFAAIFDDFNFLSKHFMIVFGDSVISKFYKICEDVTAEALLRSKPMWLFKNIKDALKKRASKGASNVEKLNSFQLHVKQLDPKICFSDEGNIELRYIIG